MADTEQFIVNALNQQPFEKGLTLVSFDKKSSGELLSILQEVIEEISELQRVNLRDELPEDTAQRIFDFLWILKYKSPVDPLSFSVLSPVVLYLRMVLPREIET